MLENVLTIKNATAAKKLSIKAMVSVCIVLLAVVLPQIAHLAVGEMAGVTLLPMYLPILLGGCILGAKWAAGVGLIAPLASFVITSLMGSPMPAAPRLPFMMAELAVFAIVSGLFSDKIVKNGLWAFAAVITAGIAGRLSFLALVFIFQSVTPFTVPMIWGQIKAGFIGLGIQAIIVPVFIIIIRKFMCDENE